MQPLLVLTGDPAGTGILVFGGDLAAVDAGVFGTGCGGGFVGRWFSIYNLWLW